MEEAAVISTVTTPRESQKQLEKETDGKTEVFKLCESGHRVTGSYFWFYSKARVA